MMELLLGLGAQLPQDAARFNQRGAKLLGEFAKRFATLNRASLGHAIERV